ncbi:MAG TPA: tripartite tricarboxylate transporter TctB family protein [Pseudolabrys sp.]|nr:tripartite tricarboxylate transporter TctB family protein [Pseudolabrys sp.]
MSHGSSSDDQSGSVVSNRTMEMVVAGAMMVVGMIVMVASYRLGAGWSSNVGPESGYFPFYVSLIMFLASGVTLVQQFMKREEDSGSFISHGGLIMVMKVLIPLIVFVVLTIYIGIYISMALFIGFFMMWVGRYPWYKVVPVAIACPIIFFVLFEIWFLVPLPKGPFEAWLGY